MGVKVSVIIPVYNAESFIALCIESLLCQTLRNCEFICINDGSRDNSQRIIEHYKKMDNRIQLINQHNQGVSSARNTGLKLASGEYVSFVDADDYIEKDMYEKLYSVSAEGNYDIALSNFESEVDEHLVITTYPFPMNTCLKTGYIQENVLPYFLKSDNLNTVCNKLYKNKIIKQNNLSFPEGVALGEDGLFNIHFMNNVITMTYLDYTGYHYREVMGSATRNIKEKDYFKRALEVYKLNLPEKLMGNVDKEKIQELKSIKLINSVMSYIHIYFSPSEELSYRKRANYIRGMIHNKYVREALPFFYRAVYPSLGRYEKCIIQLITIKSIMGLFCVTAYSRSRNKTNGGLSYEDVNVRS
jgi:glycosyltransferase involved in cell wall biosynthesis